ncbi:hypothetical protein [Kiloniella sp.]|uniref:hypothetical protein n=1 Tax=Kiloniella sp. TaxID=1938587 RepID=UPI003B02EBF5
MIFKDEFSGRADWPLLQNGAVHLYWKPEVYEDAIQSLKTLNYRIMNIHYENIDQFKSDLSSSLKWQEQFGYSPWDGNLNALNDGIREEPFNSSDRNAICISNYQALASDDKYFAFKLLDLIARHSRDYLLFGKVLIGLIQTNDPNFRCEGIGGTQASWNLSEWKNSSRGL